MYKRIPILFLWLLMNHLSAWTQSVVIPDPNFRAYLVSTHPTLMNGSQQLILSAANAFTGTVNCSNRSISNLSGIEHFHSMLTLDCSNNQISAFPSLASLSALQTLTCNNNQLSTINGLGSLTALRFLTCSHNQITSLPGLGNLTQLEILNLPGNQLSSLPGLGSLVAARYLYIYDNSLSSLENLSALTNLRGLVCKNNALTSLPALSTQTLLEDLDCSNNPITNLPSLSGLSSLRNLYVYNCALQSIPSLTSNTALRILNANNNQLSVLPDLSSNALLVELSVSSNPLTALPSLTNATLLRRLYASYCQLTQVPSLSSNTVLDTLELQYNQLSELPDLSSNTALHKVVVIGNQLSFSDLKPLTLLPLYPGNFKLFPQDTLGVYQEVKVSELNSYTFSTSIDSGFSNVVFTWLKSGAVLYQGAEPTFTLPYAQERNEGRYACEISSGDPVFSNQKILLRPLDLLVETCLETGGNCNPVITPDADGVNDEYFVSETAEVKIYSKNGQLIQEFHSPAGWDGTDKQGKLVPMGVYFIRINEQERISVTVIIQ